jgi:hypothetical protein
MIPRNLTTSRTKAAYRKVDFLHFIFSRQFEQWDNIVQTGNRFTVVATEVNMIVVMSVAIFTGMTTGVSNDSIDIHHLVNISVFHQTIKNSIDCHAITQTIESGLYIGM